MGIDCWTLRGMKKASRSGLYPVLNNFINAFSSPFPAQRDSSSRISRYGSQPSETKISAMPRRTFPASGRCTERSLPRRWGLPPRYTPSSQFPYPGCRADRYKVPPLCKQPERSTQTAGVIGRRSWFPGNFGFPC